MAAIGHHGNMETQATDTAADRQLDITHLQCPMTFVRTKLTLEGMEAGEILAVRLNAGEPLENVPRSVGDMGHEVVSLTPEAEGGPYLLLVRLCSKS
ncbi:MAG: sulfurtransferase TusA family protein [Alphaproteobacteria bacterium]|jgi:TusA-related sulfurtransferase|nr:sulfurtransferase TusA family protein [Alphaproteobacteria bacterium]MDP6238501.1 sulfurtransferase TusA family protein [Alphaproteobacteria bacterium]MDP7173072.1 sulfurtransferase TusA family protein [Alphaproteobacteria bacterium]MDP7486651.1 sulfurtransferase TusA family protein [Alphaproteobacteria bacterium]HJN21215.1 sulfurtransferase TusA family protein [Alphaproteobacteria bacterium]|tara:strand:- start:3850 stop:4140 length:291 start_codon:yes stop_codon:yes gene_type:complete